MGKSNRITRTFHNKPKPVIRASNKPSTGTNPEKIVKKVTSTYKLPYFTITPTFSICPKHGYLVGEHPFCPKCDKEIGFEEGGANIERKVIQALA